NAAEHRLHKMQHKTEERRTAADIRKELEVWFGWDTYGSTFVRNTQRATEWDSLGALWGCICFIRDGLFNPFTFRHF
ncbi:MAG: hypothetical protein KDD61_11935, partial [Bdellovibrionales bacterium]|nr:hypothetical protein [Bdellovibrionales bacterium]